MRISSPPTIGPCRYGIDTPTREELIGSATRLFDQLATTASAPVLVAVSPAQRVLQIVTGVDSSARVPNKSCALAALSMRASFSAGDLAGGIVTGLRMMSDAAGRI